MDREQIKLEAQSAELKAEAGDSKGLSTQLVNIDPVDRLAIAKEMQAINECRRGADDSLPLIQISTGTDADGNEFLQEITERERRAAYNPASWFGEKYDSGTKIYNEQLGNRHHYDPSFGVEFGRLSVPRTWWRGPVEGFISREYDVSTGKLRSAHLSYSFGSVFGIESGNCDNTYDPSTGHAKSQVCKY